MRRRTAASLMATCLLLAAGGGALQYASRSVGGDAREWVLMPPLRDFAAETDLDDYAWPTDASRIRSSSFAEFRPTHFHGGLDITTWGRTGYRVTAARGGWLHSITFEPFGYGWILVLRHPDGFYTTYAHLKGFPAGLRAAYWKKLREEGHSFGAAVWGRDELPVKKGALIAYTGESGAGPPHFHFELRDSSYNPVHPELARGLRVRDSIPPVPARMAIVPLDALSSVNGSFEPQVVSLARQAGGAYTARQTPVIRGRAGLMLLAHDRAQDAQDTPTPFEMRVQVDGKPFFVSTFAWHQESMGWHVRIDRDHWMLKGMKGEFRKLYREDGNFLAVYHAPPGGNGVLSAASVGAGRRRVHVRVADVAGNACGIDLDVDVREDGSVAPAAPDGAAPDSAAKDAVAKDAVAKDAVAKDAVAKDAAAGPGALRVTSLVHFDEVVLDLRSSTVFSRPPLATMRCGGRADTARLLQLGPDRYRAVCRGWDGLSGTVTMRVEADCGGARREWSESFEATLISAASGGELRSGDGRFTLRFAQGDVYRSMFCWLQRAEGDGRAGGLASYRAFPDDVPLAGKPVATFATAPADAPHRYVRAYHPGVPLRFNRVAQPPERGVAGAYGRLLATYTLVDDAQPPVIAVSASRGDALARFTVTDSLAGVENRSITASLGGVVLPVEFSEGARCFVVPRAGAAGVQGGVLRISAADKLGNTARREIAIR